MEFYFPDSQDQVDPNFDFVEEEHLPFHVRQRDDHYVHEALSAIPFDGVLVSKGIVDGVGGSSGRYTVAQRHRIYRVGIHQFFRLPQRVKALGDCGAFSYVTEEEPPISPQDAMDFYEGCGFDAGISVDHVILGYRSPQQPSLLPEDVPPEWVARQAITLQYAQEFLASHRANGCRFQPVGAAQGWDPNSYAESVQALQAMGYARIAMGGMVPLKTNQVLEVLEAVNEIRASTTELHLLGITRTAHLAEFARFGVTSFDSTSPFRQAFMDDRDNYYWRGRTFTAIRVPPVGGNAKLKRLIKSGAVDQNEALLLEARSLAGLRALDRGEVADVDSVLESLAAYHALFDQRDRVEEYRDTLESRPWRDCDCGICERDGIEVAIFRGTERNKRRGFHNVHVFSQELNQRLAAVA